MSVSGTTAKSEADKNEMTLKDTRYQIIWAAVWQEHPLKEGPTMHLLRREYTNQRPKALIWITPTKHGEIPDQQAPKRSNPLFSNAYMCASILWQILQGSRVQPRLYFSCFPFAFFSPSLQKACRDTLVEEGII